MKTLCIEKLARNRTNIVCKMTEHTDKVPITGKFIETESRIEVARCWGEEDRGGLLFNMYKDFVGDGENFYR